MKAFDISLIVKNFYRDIFESERRSNAEAYVLVVVPAALASVASVRPIDSEFISMMATSLAILFGFTFNSLLTTAKYSANDDVVEKEIVNQTRLGTSYALLMNLVALIAVVVVSIIVTDYEAFSGLRATITSGVVYFLMFHYLLVMMYLMRYLYLLVMGGALEQPAESSESQGEEFKEELSR